MKVFVVVNPAAGNASVLEGLLAALPEGVVVQEAATAERTGALAAAAVDAGFERVVAAGGDGTLHHLVNGLDDRLDRAAVGLLPLGTGNDFARTLALPLDPLEALDLVLRGEERRLDLFEVRVQGEDGAARRRLCVNAAQGGFSGQVQGALDDATKAAWGALAYARAAVATLPELTAYDTRVEWDDGQVERLDALNVVVANGRSVGAGMRVAPDADPEDGLLDVVIVRPGSALALAGLGARLAAGYVMGSDLVLHRRARGLGLSARPAMPFNADGDLLPAGSVRFQVLPGALRVVCGDDYVAGRSRAARAVGWTRRDSHPRPPPCKGGALLAELRGPSARRRG